MNCGTSCAKAAEGDSELDLAPVTLIKLRLSTSVPEKH